MVINIYIRFLVPFFFGFIILVSTSIAHSALEITGVNHPSNYRLSKDPVNLAQLVDGETQIHPLWTRDGSLGWVSRTPLSFNLLHNNIDTDVTCYGSVRIHTGKSKNADVNVPRRVDLYIKKKSGEKYLFSSGEQIEGKIYRNNKSHWIEINDIILSKEMIVVIHGDGKYIMLDEITTSIDKCNVVKDKNTGNIFIEDPVVDSLKRLKRTFQSDAAKLNIQESTGNTLIPKIYNNISDYLSQNHSSVGQAAEISGYRGEKESRVISFKNYSDEDVKAGVSYLKQNGGPDLEIYRIEKVLAANGKQVYDPLIPVNTTIVLNANSDNLFLVKFYLNDVFNGVSKIKITSNSELITSDIIFNISVLDIGGEQFPLNVNVWSYRNNRLFKTDEKKSIDVMQECGVNVFVVHRSLLPDVRSKSVWTKSKKSLLKKELEFYKDKGLILLFANWRKNKIGYLKKGGLNRDLIGGWLSQIQDVMAELGMDNNDWALYPIDEPTGTELEYLYSLAKIVKAIDKNIQIYANPISTNANPSNDKQLDRLTDLIDYWQPSFKYVTVDGVGYFSNLDTDWWIYDNPPSPAKAAGDLFYRRIAWEAWSINAKGIGFWSFSDTGGSSSWDDFDGVRPDYAVIYEYEDTITKSLRWESFCDGVEDFRLLNATEFESEHKSEILNKMQKGEFTHRDIELYRKHSLRHHSKAKDETSQQ